MGKNLGNLWFGLPVYDSGFCRSNWENLALKCIVQTAVVDRCAVCLALLPQTQGIRLKYITSQTKQ